MKITPAQQGYIEAVKQSKVRHDKLVAEENVRHQYALDQLRIPVQQVVRQAESVKIPESRIYRDGLGMADYRTFKKFMAKVDGPTTTTAEMSGEIEEPVEQAAYGTGEWEIYPTNHPQSLRLVAPDGTEKKLDVMIDSGLHAARFSKYEWDEIPEELKTALLAYYPTGAVMGLYNGEQEIWRDA